jgi:hypothetical protein
MQECRRLRNDFGKHNRWLLDAASACHGASAVDDSGRSSSIIDHAFYQVFDFRHGEAKTASTKQSSPIIAPA